MTGAVRTVRVIGPKSAQIAIMSDQTLRYRYEVKGFGGFCFPTLAEVGQPWHPRYRKLLEKLPVRFSVELDRYPWVADMLIKEKA